MMRVGYSLLWGLFCACSWTWCIGMYLPRLMIQRFGWPGFIAFAAPNVLGCAAFGYVIRNRARSEAIVGRGATAMTWFSIVTVAYHMFFVVWLFDELIAVPEGWLATPLVAAIIVLGLGVVFSFLPNRDWLGLSVLVYAISLAAFLSIGAEPLRGIAWHGSRSGRELALLAPVLCLGFLLCPYLDLTFHRAVRNAPSRHAFGMFGVAFTVMIVLTCAIWFGPGVGAGRLGAIALAHILAQSVFTVGAHLREIRVSPAIADSGRRALGMIGPLAAAPLLYIGRLVWDSPMVGERMYLAFLGLYAVVFPVWMLVCVRWVEGAKKTPSEARG